MVTLPDLGAEFDSPGDALRSLRSVYRDHPEDTAAVESLLDLALLRSPRRSTVAARIQREQKLASLRNVAERLLDTDVAVAVDDVAAVLATLDPGEGSSAGAIDTWGCVLVATAAVTDVRSWHEEAATGHVVERLEEAREELRAGSAATAVEDVRLTLTELYEVVALVLPVERLDRKAAALNVPDPLDVTENLEAVSRVVVADHDVERLERTAAEVEALPERAWSRQDLVGLEPREFETLVAELWEDSGADVTTTQRSHDRNVDIVARRSEGCLELFQAKHRSSGGKVGRPVVQRSAGLLVEFDADGVTVVTNGTFTEPARESANDVPDVRLFDGEDLCELLTESTLVPPPLLPV